MKYLNNFKKFKESIVVDLTFQSVNDMLESLNILYDTLLSSINAEELDIYDTLMLPSDFLSGNLDLNLVSNSSEFIKSLTKLSLKKSELKNSDDFETFLNKPCRFMFIFDINSNELENPVYLLFQVWSDTLKVWGDLRLYKVNDDVKKFYDKLSSKTIEIIDGDENYIYNISSGNEFVLRNREKMNDVYKDVFRKDEFKDFLSKRNVKVNII
jgi:hypothetical protein